MTIYIYFKSNIIFIEKLIVKGKLNLNAVFSVIFMTILFSTIILLLKYCPYYFCLAIFQTYDIFIHAS